MHLTAEFTPYARTGGLAEAVQGLADIQTRQGIRVFVIVPLYRTIRRVAKNLEQVGNEITIHIGPRREQVKFFRDADRKSGPEVIFVEHQPYFDREGIYVEKGADYPDNPRRFALFARAAIEAISIVAKGPLLVHAHDWHASLALVYMRSYADLRERFRGTGAVLSVHNAGYQGYFSPAVIGDLGIPPETFNLHQLEWYGQVNFLKGGLAFCDYAVTVSPSHGVERWRSDCGCALAPEKHTSQLWRTDLRASLEWLAGELHHIFDRDGETLFTTDPWAVRDAYGDVVGASVAKAFEFIAGSISRRNDEGRIERAAELLEMEEGALKMFTSCAWFFDDLARIETIQVLKYAAFAIDLSGDAARLEQGFLDRIGHAKSNDPKEGTGLDIWHTHVRKE